MNAYTTKSKDMNITAFSIKGTRWFQKSFGNTYHKAYVSALIGDEWVELGSTPMQYGGNDQYIVSGMDWLVENGFIPAEGYSSHYSFYKENNITTYAQDVKRQKDL